MSVSPVEMPPPDLALTEDAIIASPQLAARALLVLQTAMLLMLTSVIATKVWQDDVWIGWVMVAATVLVWLPELRRDRARRWWFAYVAGIFVYTLLRSYAGKTFIPIQTGYVISFDRDLFRGTLPVIWLQTRLFSPTHVSAVDMFAVGVHWSFFIAPHACAIAIFLWRRELFPRYVALVVGTMYVGLVFFFLVPTTPPWLASQANDLPGQAFRIMDFVGGQVNVNTYRTFYASLAEPNSVAAMPSIHMAVTFAMYLWARDHYPKVARLLLVYSLVMGFALVYLAEHYLLDLAAGVVVALICHHASRRLVPAPATF
jgi:membrane-associated phospholipid phosphatase